ncbi:uncharacterized protein LACBIDRAFT_189769 [Laccaria bicolor S238N-H82]|uniref:WD repeat-containing protein JIP5 n=1 Tax=Laccaria bicolor (strain S238N-H82 / ATCC MYA-4686) TaxID=486041 RepID=JIP5_LACBS|nr:uncharacterized protein LACBIDRAFT_189769 [Laccaria bicolor S238N-H82]B0D442.1 RecName: Full=WD repeat-containing protein JIP5 [Laccaria bicolor S238N-H82]EDR10266.1 predicted protein [Laccaria bicolor S238N-H82]|eukprot:XP_001878716.1 predicted protein [Laccaria bicolor S238N-H82]
MPEIDVGSQIFDVVFHPTFATVYTGLLNGHVKAFAYNEQGKEQAAFSVRPSKRSCRGLSIKHDGTHLYAVGKAKALKYNFISGLIIRCSVIDTATAQISTRPGAHDSTINRVKYLMPWLISTGDDDGVIKLWDPRQQECVREYTQHFDYITDFLWLDDKKQLVATSGDGTLSVMDVRSKKPEPFAQSEDQDDELLSIVAIKGHSKIVVGTQLGILSIFNRSKGWGDCVDRVPGHPLSIDALCNLPPGLPNVDPTSTVLTGSSDGYVRAVQILPTKLLGVVADHGEWPIERIAVGGGWWVGSVGHEDLLRMTDLEGFFLDQSEDKELKGALGVTNENEQSDEDEEMDVLGNDAGHPEVDGSGSSSSGESSEDSEASDGETPQAKQRKRKIEQKPLDVDKPKGRNEIDVENAFFDEL